jgi:L-ascorbate metabolism protein UlaG (beta-lactamase superfamily)
MEFEGLEIAWLGHAAVRVRMGDGTTVLIDPWLAGNPACPESEHTQERADVVYVTHGHFDHVGDSLELVKRTGAPLHAIHEVATWFAGQGVEAAIGSNKGGTVESVAGIKATLVDAVHSSGISGDAGIIPGGEAAGWVLEFPGGPTLYHAGDTAAFGDLRLIGELHQPDLAFLPIGGWYTMGPQGAAVAAKLLGVERVVPIHFGTFPILAGTPDELRSYGGGAFDVMALEIGA